MKIRPRRFAVLALAAALALSIVPAPAPAPAAVFRVTDGGTDNNLGVGFDTLVWTHENDLVKYVDTPARDYVTLATGFGYDLASSAQVGPTFYFSDKHTLWSSDGTANSAAAVATLPSDPADEYTVKALTDLNGTLIFRGFSIDSGFEPWTSNGTGPGTSMVKDVFPGFDYGYSYWGDQAILAGALYFNGDDGVNGEELWVTNGQEAGTFMVKDINTAAPAAGSAPRTFVACGPNVYFIADDGVHGSELWMTGGTAGSTLLAADIHPGASGSGILEMTCVGSRLFLWASNTPSDGDELWLYDPAAIPTSRLLKGSWSCDLNPYGCGPQTNTFRAVGDLLMFAAGDNAGVELWKSDGTPAGTVMVKDIWPGLDYSTGSPFPFSSEPYRMAVKDGRLYFRAEHPDFGGEVWVSDGTAANTWPVTDVLPGPGNTYPDSLTAAGRFVFFRVNGDYSFNVWGFDPADTPPYRDLVVDGSFESNPTAAKWARLGLAPTQDIRVCNQRSLERCSFKIVGSTTATKGLRQTILRSGGLGDANEMISLSGWSKSQGTAATGGVFALELLVSYKDGTSAKKLVAFSRGTHAWEYKRVQLKAAKPWSKATVAARYERLPGTAWFDDVRLTIR